MEYESYEPVRPMKRFEEHLKRDETRRAVDLVSALRGSYANDDRERAYLRVGIAVSIALSTLFASRFARQTRAIGQFPRWTMTDVMRCSAQNRYLSRGGEMMPVLARCINLAGYADRRPSSAAIPFGRAMLQKGTSFSAVRSSAG